MADLFEYAERYPASPGYKEQTTSRAAADSMKGETSRLRRMVIAALRDGGPATADELAVRIGETVLSTRPRLTELQALGEVFDTGRRGRNASGRNAKIFDLTGERN